VLLYKFGELAMILILCMYLRLFLLNKPLLLLNIWLCIFWLFDSLSSQLCYWLIVELLKSRKLKMWSIISIFDLYIIVYFADPSELFIQTPSLVVVVLTESTLKYSVHYVLKEKLNVDIKVLTSNTVSFDFMYIF
jgi:hypothetical protein